MTNNVPRNFKLLEELDNVGKYATISYGTDDNTLESFSGSIFAKNGNIYQVTIYCDHNYPSTPPDIFFPETDNLPNICNLDGSIKQNILDTIKWNLDAKSIGDVLTRLEKQII